MFTVEGILEFVVNVKAVSVHYMVALRVNRFWVIFLLDFVEGYIVEWFGHKDLVKTLFSVTRGFIIVKAIDQLLLEERALNNH